MRRTEPMSDLATLHAIRLHVDEWRRLTEAHPSECLCASPAKDRAVLLEMVERYRRRFLDIATAAGEDTSGLDNPDQLVTPPIEEMALEAVQDLADRYDECLREHP